MTDLMYGRRVSKTDARVAAYGAVDEMNAALGVARVEEGDAAVGETIASIQKSLITVMGELATAAEDLDRYVKDGFSLTTDAMVSELTAGVERFENEFEIRFKGWAIPGENATARSAHLDVARTICRRAEREVAALFEAGLQDNREILRYLNRLSDLLWLMARHENALRSDPSNS